MSISTRNREVRADRYEDISTLPSFEANCADEIYAGHVADHVDDVKATFGRRFEALGGRITITVPDCRGANRMWFERKRFPALELGPDEGIIAITTGVKADKSRRPKRGGGPAQSSLRRIDAAICIELVGFINIAPVDNYEAMVALLGAGLATRARRLQTEARLRTTTALSGRR